MKSYMYFAKIFQGMFFWWVQCGYYGKGYSNIFYSSRLYHGNVECRHTLFQWITLLPITVHRPLWPRNRKNYNFSKMQNLMLENGSAKKSPLGLGAIWSVSARDIFNVGIEQLRKDPFFFLDRVPRKQPWKK